MARDDDPQLSALAARIFREKILPEINAKGVGAMLLLSPFGKGGATAYAANVERESAISTLEELVLNLHAERARGPREPTVVESLHALTRAAIRVLEVSEEHVSEEEGVKRFSELAALVGYPPTKKIPPA